MPGTNSSGRRTPRPREKLKVEAASNNVLETLTLDGTYYQNQFHLNESGSTDQITYAACYCRGTLIATANGEIAVEDLKIGDSVVTASGALRKIVWIGTRAYSPRFAGNNPDLLPIRFRAGSLDYGVPRRDLLVSPEHAMFLDGVLIWPSISSMARPSSRKSLKTISNISTSNWQAMTG